MQLDLPLMKKLIFYEYQSMIVRKNIRNLFINLLNKIKSRKLQPGTEELMNNKKIFKGRNNVIITANINRIEVKDRFILGFEKLQAI